MKNMKKSQLFPILVGVVLIVVGICIQIPGGALTTRNYLNGKSADNDYYFSNKYSTIDEYVGGDAYNFIIGSALVAGKMAGRMTTKAILIACGVLCVCFGMTMVLKDREGASVNNSEPITAEEESVKEDEASTDSETPEETKEEIEG